MDYDTIFGANTSFISQPMIFTAIARMYCLRYKDGQFYVINETVIYFILTNVLKHHIFGANR